MLPVESLTPNDLEATLRIEAIRTAEDLIDQVSQAPGYPYGDWKVGVMPEDNGVIFGRGGEDISRPTQSIILKKLGSNIHVHAYERMHTGENSFEMRTWHSILADVGDAHEASMETNKMHVKTQDEARTEQIPPLTLADVHSIVHSIAREQGKPARVAPQPQGWLQNLKLVSK